VPQTRIDAATRDSEVKEVRAPNVLLNNLEPNSELVRAVTLSHFRANTYVYSSILQKSWITVIGITSVSS
jgi:hypothetical protein